MEYFIVANSFAAPFVSDQSEHFEEADSPEKALKQFAARYSHPARLFAAACYSSATAYHKNEKFLARWLCNHELAKQKAMKLDSAVSYRGIAPGKFEVNGKLVVVDDPFGGQIEQVFR